MRRWTAPAALVLLSGALVAAGAFGPVARPQPVVEEGARLAYGSAEFRALVEESYRHAGARGLPGFEAWWEERYERTFGRSLRQALAEARARLGNATSAAERAARQLEVARWAHRTVKTLLPNFDVNRGHEFANAVRFGARQCYLQSVLVASLLQAAGVPAGVFMVWRNPQGQESNNGHATAFALLGTGDHALVDASYPEPFVPHRGVFGRTGDGYRFLEPVYGNGGRIVAYRRPDGRRQPGGVGGLDAGFVRSQFHYYRGERAPGGPLARRPTPEGLRVAARFLREAERVAPANALAAYMLGHVYRRQGRTAAARAQYLRAYRLYATYGWVPSGVLQAHVWAAGR